jgi:hypothetical protein
MLTIDCGIEEIIAARRRTVRWSYHQQEVKTDELS